MIKQEGGFIREIVVRKKTLDQILRECDFPAVDYITIDVEGHEMEVLKGFSLDVYKPRVVIIEDNSKCSDYTVKHYMQMKGYVHFRRTGVNDWYASEKDSELVNYMSINALEKIIEVAKLESRIVKPFMVFKRYLPISLRIFLKKVLVALLRVYNILADKFYKLLKLN
jgi:hypothetical protein